MPERYKSLLEKINKEYAGFCAEDIFRMINEGLKPDDKDDRAEYKNRLENGTLRPINIPLSPEAKTQIEQRLITERLATISHTIASPQSPGKRSADYVGSTIDPQRTKIPRHYDGYGG